MGIFLDPDDYSCVVIPHGVWNGFKGAAELSLIANYCTHAHDRSRSTHLEPFTDRIHNDWTICNQWA